jgi:mRNA interferase MazF
MRYIPDQGDIIYLQFSPQVGYEQMGTRPAIVVSNKTYNHFTKLAIVCPIISTDKSFPLHVLLDDRTRTTGVVMCEQMKAFDIYARKASFFEKAPKDIVDEVMDIIVGFIE